MASAAHNITKSGFSEEPLLRSDPVVAPSPPPPYPLKLVTRGGAINSRNAGYV